MLRAAIRSLLSSEPGHLRFWQESFAGQGQPSERWCARRACSIWRVLGLEKMRWAPVRRAPVRRAPVRRSLVFPVEPCSAECQVPVLFAWRLPAAAVSLPVGPWTPRPACSCRFHEQCCGHETRQTFLESWSFFLWTPWPTWCSWSFWMFFGSDRPALISTCCVWAQVSRNTSPFSLFYSSMSFESASFYLAEKHPSVFG
jgi:hypothetical protein